MLCIDLPRYAYIDDLILIGTNHLLDSRADPAKREKFLQEVSEADHLFLEGYEHSYTCPANPHNFEMLAFHNRPPSTRFLEEGEDFIEANGIRRDLFGMYMTFLNLPMAVMGCKSEQDLLKNIRSLTHMLANTYPAIDSDAALAQFLGVTDAHRDIRSLVSLGNSWAYHSSRNRDHYIFGPKTKRWKEELKGKKVELVGHNHFIFLLDYLRGEAPAPVQWRDTLNPGLRSIAYNIEEVMFPQKSF